MMNRYSLSLTALTALAFATACAPAVEPEAPTVETEPADAVAPINESSIESEIEEQPASDDSEIALDAAAGSSDVQPEAAHSDDDHEDHDHDEHAHDEGHDDHNHGGEAHVHGEAELLIAIEGENISVSFESPLANLIGFENEPQTDAESEAYNAMRNSLAESDTVLTFSEAANCTHYSSETSIRRNGDHATMIADYEFTCEDMAALRDGTVPAFRAFEGLESVDLAIVSETGQSAASLSASDTRFVIGQ